MGGVISHQLACSRYGVHIWKPRSVGNLLLKVCLIVDVGLVFLVVLLSPRRQYICRGHKPSPNLEFGPAR